MNKNKLISVLEKIRIHRCCVYLPHKICDCKCGATDLGTGYAGGESYGCPELRLCIKILEKMTKEEYNDFLNR